MRSQKKAALPSAAPVSVELPIVQRNPPLSAESTPITLLNDNNKAVKLLFHLTRDHMRINSQNKFIALSSISLATILGFLCAEPAYRLAATENNLWIRLLAASSVTITKTIVQLYFFTILLAKTSINSKLHYVGLSEEHVSNIEYLIKGGIALTPLLSLAYLNYSSPWPNKYDIPMILSDEITYAGLQSLFYIQFTNMCLNFIRKRLGMDSEDSKKYGILMTNNLEKEFNKFKIFLKANPHTNHPLSSKILFLETKLLNDIRNQRGVFEPQLLQPFGEIIALILQSHEIQKIRTTDTLQSHRLIIILSPLIGILFAAAAFFGVYLNFTGLDNAWVNREFSWLSIIQGVSIFAYVASELARVILISSINFIYQVYSYNKSDSRNFLQYLTHHLFSHAMLNMPILSASSLVVFYTLGVSVAGIIANLLEIVARYLFPFMQPNVVLLSFELFFAAAYLLAVPTFISKGCAQLLRLRYQNTPAGIRQIKLDTHDAFITQLRKGMAAYLFAELFGVPHANTHKSADDCIVEVSPAVKQLILQLANPKNESQLGNNYYNELSSYSEERDTIILMALAEAPVKEYCPPSSLCAGIFTQRFRPATALQEIKNTLISRPIP